MNYAFACSLIAASVMVACNGGSFSGDTAKPPAKSANASPTTTDGGTGDPGSATGDGTGGPGGGNAGDGTGSVDAIGGPGGPLEIPSDCTSSGVTQANLLTKQLPNYVPNAVDYEIYLTDCDGKVKTLSSQFILFDVNASAKGIGKGYGLTYEVSDATSGASLAKGTLNEVKGTDLFGNAGPNFFYYKTDKVVTATTGAQRFKLRINLPSECCTINDTLTPAADQLIDTFLKLGAAAPVKKVIRFLASTPPLGD